MKMTRLEWRYLQRIALDHPYYDTHKPPLSDAEAKAIMEANNIMTGREFVDSIYAKLGMTRTVKEKIRLAWLRDIGELFTIPPIRKIAIAILVVLLMTVFFAATPTGRAIAESVIQYITTLFNDGRLIVNRNDNVSTSVLLDGEDTTSNERQDEESSQDSFVFVDSFEIFEMNTGKTPIILPLPTTAIYYEYDETIDYLSLHSTYETQNGRIEAFQVWNAEELISSTLTGFSSYKEDDAIFYSTEGGKIIIQKSLEDSVFGLIAIGNYSLDELIDLIRGR
jgi:hypothetical protein